MKVIITDPLLDPFYLIKTQYDYAIIEKIIPKEGKPYEKTRGYCLNVQTGIASIVMRQFPHKEKYNSIKEYLDHKRFQNQQLQTLIEKLK